MRFVGQSDKSKKFPSTRLRPRARHTLHSYRRGDDVLKGRHVGEEVVALEHDADVLARRGDLAFRHALSLPGARIRAIADWLAVHCDGAFLVILQLLMQRSNVVLPEPLGPITTTASAGATVSEMPRSTWLAPKLFTMPAIASMGRGWVSGGSVANEGPSLKVSSIQGHGVADAEVDRRGSQENLEWRQSALHHFAARHRQFP